MAITKMRFLGRVLQKMRLQLKAQVNPRPCHVAEVPMGDGWMAVSFLFALH
jgi:hypothetical protein